jgi:hypothetical protein
MKYGVGIDRWSRLLELAPRRDIWPRRAANSDDSPYREPRHDQELARIR